MATRDSEIRAAGLRDFPLIKRLTENGYVLNSELGLTRDNTGPNGFTLSGVLLPHRGLHTFLGRIDGQYVVGQFRLRDEINAQMVFIAPHLQPEASDTAWLHILDALTQEAGKRGAHILTAEVDEDSMLFETMRIAGFAIYARQEIWQREPGPVSKYIEQIELDEMTDADLPAVQSLYCKTTPRLVQQINDLPAQGYVYRANGRIEGYVAISEGKHGIYLIPCLHPDMYPNVPAIITSAIARVARADRLPIYFRVRRYQEWLESALAGLGFEPTAQQAVMVRHITAGIRSAAFAPLHRALEALPSPAGRVTESIIDLPLQE